MITLYGGPTPNTRKVTVALEEMELAWRFILIDMLQGDQLTPEFLKLNPNNKTPVIIDDEYSDSPMTEETKSFLWREKQYADKKP